MLQEPDLWRSKVAANMYEQPASLSRARSSTPQRYARPAEASRFIDVGPIGANDRLMGCGLPAMGHAPVVQPRMGPPVMVCRHVAAGLTAGACSDACAEAAMDNGAMRSSGMFVGQAPSCMGRFPGGSDRDVGSSLLTPTLGRMEHPLVPGVQTSGIWDSSWRGGSSGGAPALGSRAGAACDRASSASAVMGQRTTAQSAAALHAMSQRRDALSPRSAWAGSHAAAWGAAPQGSSFTATPGMVASTGSYSGSASNAGAAVVADGMSAPPEEPSDIAPQGSMRRPSRSKLARA